MRLNPLTPRSDKHATSIYNIHALCSKQVMRILKLILIYHQILMTNLQGHLQQVERRVNNQIFGFKGLKSL